MTVSVWRYAHLLLAIISALFLAIAAATGVVLAVDAAQENTLPYRVEGSGEITLAQSIPALKKKYPELLELSVDHNGFVTASGFDEEGNDFKFYVHPLTGEVLGRPIVKSGFVQWNLALHRSLFLHETGRFIVGIVSFLLMLIVVSGIILIIKRQQGIRHFFGKMTKDFLAQYYHVVTGRILLIPVFLLAATGTYLFLARFELIGTTEATLVRTAVNDSPAVIPVSDFPAFRETLLKDVKKLEFPLDDDPGEYYRLQRKDRELIIHQVSGTVMEEHRYPLTAVWERLSLDLHTGRTNIIWAVVLGIASLNILIFIYTGFAITFKRIGIKTRNRYSSEEAEYVFLVGSENGSTLRFANQVHAQLLAAGKKSYLTELNKYKRFPRARQLVVFSSTFGLGDAPSGATRFEQLLEEIPQTQPVQFSVVGFGSRTYEDYCGFAVKLHEWIGRQAWAEPGLPLYTVNDKSTEDFVHWVKDWSRQLHLNLVTSPAMYGGKPPGLRKLKVTQKGTATETNDTFKISFRPAGGTAFRSGDLLAVYPANDDRERLYSISKQGKQIQLVVKLHEFGLGSQYLHKLKAGEIIKGRIVSNPSFHFPSKAAAVIMIANGTGIAPFLGMITGNRHRKEVHLYAGFRHETFIVKEYQQLTTAQIKNKQLRQVKLAFSREQNQCYVMDLIKKDAGFFAQMLEEKAVLMICGSLGMQQDVEAVLETICLERTGTPLSHYRSNGQLLTDCY